MNSKNSSPLNSIDPVDVKGQNPYEWLEANGFNPDDWDAIPHQVGYWETRTREDDEPVVLERGGFRFERKAEKRFDFRQMEAFRKVVARDVKAAYKHRGAAEGFTEGSGWGDQQLQKVDALGGSEASLRNWHEARAARNEHWAKRKPTKAFHINGGDLTEGHFTGSAKSGMLDMGTYEALPLAFMERCADIEEGLRMAGEYHDISPVSNHDEIRIAGSKQGANANDIGIAISIMAEEAFRLRGIGPAQGLYFHRPARFEDHVSVPEFNLMAMHGDKPRGKYGAEVWLAKQPKLAKVTLAFGAHYHHPMMRYWGINPFTGSERFFIQLPALEPSSSWIEALDGQAVSRPGLWLGAIDADGGLVPMASGFVPVGPKPEPAF